MSNPNQEKPSQPEKVETFLTTSPNDLNEEKEPEIEKEKEKKENNTQVAVYIGNDQEVYMQQDSEDLKFGISELGFKWNTGPHSRPFPVRLTFRPSYIVENRRSGLSSTQAMRTRIKRYTKNLRPGTNGSWFQALNGESLTGWDSIHRNTYTRLLWLEGTCMLPRAVIQSGGGAILVPAGLYLQEYLTSETFKPNQAILNSYAWGETYNYILTSVNHPTSKEYANSFKGFTSNTLFSIIQNYNLKERNLMAYNKTAMFTKHMMFRMLSSWRLSDLRPSLQGVCVASIGAYDGTIAVDDVIIRAGTAPFPFYSGQQGTLGFMRSGEFVDAINGNWPAYFPNLERAFNNGKLLVVYLSPEEMQVRAGDTSISYAAFMMWLMALCPWPFAQFMTTGNYRQNYNDGALNHNNACEAHFTWGNTMIDGYSSVLVLVPTNTVSVVNVLGALQWGPDVSFWTGVAGHFGVVDNAELELADFLSSFIRMFLNSERVTHMFSIRKLGGVSQEDYWRAMSVVAAASSIYWPHPCLNNLGEQDLDYYDYDTGGGDDMTELTSNPNNGRNCFDCPCISPVGQGFPHQSYRNMIMLPDSPGLAWLLESIGFYVMKDDPSGAMNLPSPADLHFYMKILSFQYRIGNDYAHSSLNIGAFNSLRLGESMDNQVLRRIQATANDWTSDLFGISSPMDDEYLADYPEWMENDHYGGVFEINSISRWRTSVYSRSFFISAPTVFDPGNVMSYGYPREIMLSTAVGRNNGGNGVITYTTQKNQVDNEQLSATVLSLLWLGFVIRWKWLRGANHITALEETLNLMEYNGFQPAEYNDDIAIPTAYGICRHAGFPLRNLNQQAFEPALVDLRVTFQNNDQNVSSQWLNVGFNSATVRDFKYMSTLAEHDFDYVILDGRWSHQETNSDRRVISGIRRGIGRKQRKLFSKK